MIKVMISLCVLSIGVVFAGEWKQGDIILQEGKSGQAEMIKRASGSKWTHVGMIVKDARGAVRVLEAVQPVRFVKVDAFLKRTKNYKVMRLKIPVEMTSQRFKKAQEYVMKQLNKH